MIGRKLTILGIIGLLAAAPVQSQVVIQAQLLQRDLRLFFLSDFNFTGRSRTTAEFFSVTISNTSVSSQSGCLRMQIDRRSGARLEPLASGTTDPFPLSPGQVIRITNLNLFSQARQFSLNDYAIESSGEGVRDQVLATGKLPSGIYRFTFQLQPCGGGSFTASDSYFEIDVSNPTNLDLIGPGAPAGRGAPSISPTLFPLFRWSSTLSRFRLTLAEKLADVHDSASPAEIIQDRVRFQRTLTLDPARSGGAAADGSEYIATTRYAYPATGGWPLEPGKTYYWQITGLAAAPGEEIGLPSEIWAFTVQPGGASGTAEIDLAGVLATLRPASGEALSAYLARGGELDGYSLTGRFWLNGRWITREEVQAILVKLATGEYKIIETRVE